MKRAIVPFSGDPIHFGHIDLIERASKEYDELIVGFGVNSSKSPLFTLEERMEMAEKALSHVPNVKIVSFPGMLVDYAYENCIPTVVKGVRNSADFEYESILNKVGESQELGIETRLMSSKPEHEHISSSCAKGIMKAQGMVHKYVPLYVKQRLEAKVLGQYIVGVTGEPGVGKSYVAKQLEEFAQKSGVPVINVNMDNVGHEILGSLDCPRYQEVRKEIESVFGSSVVNEDGSINTKPLGEIVFSDEVKLQKLNEIMYHPMRVRFRREVLGRKGLVLMDAALIAELGFGHFCNNNVVLVDADESVQRKRLEDRNLSAEQIERRLQSQYDFDRKKKKLCEADGKTWIVGNSKDVDIEGLYNNLVNELDLYGELRFNSLWNRIKADGNADHVYQGIAKAYSASSRHYHTLSHLMIGLEEFENCKEYLENPDAVLFAWYFHDFVDNQGSRFNEENSAAVADKVLAQALVSEEFRSEVKEQILATKHFGNSSKDYITDMDLAIFGRDEFDAYCSQVRLEYAYVPDKVYNVKRAEILQEFLDRDQIYHTEYFREKYEAKARENLEKEIRRLK